MAQIIAAHEVTDELLSDILTTAVEGGIGYWSAVTDCERVKGGERDLCWLSVTLVPYGEDEWGVFEGEKDTAPITVTLADVARGIECVLIDPKCRTNGAIRAAIMADLGVPIEDTGNIDAEAADCIIQAACFGEIVFG